MHIISPRSMYKDSSQLSYLLVHTGFSFFANASIPIFLSSVAKLPQNSLLSVSNPRLNPSSKAAFTASLAAATASGLYAAIFSARSKAPVIHSSGEVNNCAINPYFNASSEFS